MASQDPRRQLVVMDVTEPKENRATGERLDPRVHLVLREAEGQKGEAGIQGPAGQKGEGGEKGESGNPGVAQLSSHMNWKECTYKNEDGKDAGEIYANVLFLSDI